jgi:hypothetical protein
MRAWWQVGDGLVLAVNVFPPSSPKADQRGRYEDATTSLVVCLVNHVAALASYDDRFLRDGGWEVREGNDVPRVLSNAVRYAMSRVIAKKRGT